MTISRSNAPPSLAALAALEGVFSRDPFAGIGAGPRPRPPIADAPPPLAARAALEGGFSRDPVEGTGAGSRPRISIADELQTAAAATAHTEYCNANANDSNLANLLVKPKFHVSVVHNPEEMNINVFISHSWAYSEHYERLAEWIFADKWSVTGQPIRFCDMSVPKDHPIHHAPDDATLEHAITQRIGNCHVVVIPTGMYATHSKWIGKEIEGAKQLGRPIVAVDPWGQKRTSSRVADSADETVKWNKQSIIDAVWRQGKKRISSW